MGRRWGRASGDGAPGVTLTGPADAALVRAVQRGDAEAFETLVRRHLPAAYAQALREVNDADEAEDICQDAMILALERIRQCREPERFGGWLLTIVRNRARSHTRREALRATVPMGAEPMGSAPVDPARAAARSELSTHLDLALGGLTPIQRSVLVRYDLEGWTHREIAEELGISPVGSRFHLHVARKALKARLSGLYGKEIPA